MQFKLSPVHTHAGRRDIWITPSKPAGATRGRMQRPTATNSEGVILIYFVELLRSSEMAGVSSYPELRFAYSGLSMFHAFGVSATI